jgi:hypothetical protein
MGLFCLKCDFIYGTNGAPALIHASDCPSVEWDNEHHMRYHPGFDPVPARRDAVRGSDGLRYWPNLPDHIGPA